MRRAVLIYGKPRITFPSTLLVTEQTIDISGFSPRQKDFYLDLFWEVVAVYRAKNKPRVLIGIAGPTGAGKSVVAVLFKELARQAGLPFVFEPATIDAWHFIDSDPERAKAPVLQRHMTGGRTLAEATRHYEQVDARNSALVLRTKSRADKVIPPYYLVF